MRVDRRQEDHPGIKHPFSHKARWLSDRVQISNATQSMACSHDDSHTFSPLSTSFSRCKHGSRSYKACGYIACVHGCGTLPSGYTCCKGYIPDSGCPAPGVEVLCAHNHGGRSHEPSRESLSRTSICAHLILSLSASKSQMHA